MPAFIYLKAYQNGLIYQNEGLPGTPAEPFDTQESKNDGVADGDQEGHVGMGIPGAWLNSCGDEVFHGTIGGPFDEFTDLFAEDAQFAEHTDHDKGEVDESGGGIHGLGVLDEADDDLSQAEVDGAADDGHYKAEGVGAGAEGDLVIFIANQEEYGGHEDDHDQLYGKAAEHDGPIGGGGYAKALENAFVPVFGDGIGVAHETDGGEAYGDTVGQNEGASEFFDQPFPGDEDDRGDEDDHDGGPAVAPLGGQVGAKEGLEDDRGRRYSSLHDVIFLFWYGIG